jgi:hypothetical protein
MLRMHIHIRIRSIDDIPRTSEIAEMVKFETE